MTELRRKLIAIAYLAKQKNYRLYSRNGIIKLEHYGNYGWDGMSTYKCYKTIEVIDLNETVND